MDNNEEVKMEEGMENSAPVENIMIADEEPTEEEVAQEANTEEVSE